MKSLENWVAAIAGKQKIPETICCKCHMLGIVYPSLFNQRNQPKHTRAAGAANLAENLTFFFALSICDGRVARDSSLILVLSVVV